MKLLTDGIEIIQEGKRGFIPFLALESIMMRTIYGKGKHILNFNNKKASWNELKRLEYVKDNEIVFHFPVFSMIFSFEVLQDLHKLYIESKTTPRSREVSSHTLDSGYGGGCGPCRGSK